jgi:hypothetical protein
MQLWTQFYAAIGAASAALLGLLFVAVSIVSAAFGPEEAVSRQLTEQAFQNYLAVMMVAFLALFPGIETTTFGMVTLITTASWSIWSSSDSVRRSPNAWDGDHGSTPYDDTYRPCSVSPSCLSRRFAWH